MECDVELGVRVCRSAGYYDHALALAARHGLHHHHLAILIDDKKDYSAALRCAAIEPWFSLLLLRLQFSLFVFFYQVTCSKTSTETIKSPAYPFL